MKAVIGIVIGVVLALIDYGVLVAIKHTATPWHHHSKTALALGVLIVIDFIVGFVIAGKMGKKPA